MADIDTGCSDVERHRVLWGGFHLFYEDSFKDFNTFNDVGDKDWVAIDIEEYETGEHTLTILLKNAGIKNALIREYKAESKCWEPDFAKVRSLLANSHCRPEFDRRHLHTKRLEAPGRYFFRRDQRFR